MDNTQQPDLLCSVVHSGIQICTQDTRSDHVLEKNDIAENHENICTDGKSVETIENEADKEFSDKTLIKTANLCRNHSNDIDKSLTENNGILNNTRNYNHKSIINGSVPNTDAVSSSNDNYSVNSNQEKSKTRKIKKSENLEHVMKSLKHLNNPDEKLSAICKKYQELFNENKILKEHEKTIVYMTKEQEVLQSQLQKSNSTRTRLENLCRELQRQNKLIQEESLKKIKEEEEKRKAVSSKFQATVNEITSLMKKDTDKTTKLLGDNIDMSTKLKSITSQHELREQEIEKMTKQMILEAQLYDAKIGKLKMEMDTEKEILLREKQQLLVNLTEYQARCKEYQNIELALRGQISMYSSKYEEFQNALSRSNQVFSEFKSEMENMSKKIVRLESETANWKQRWENTQQALLEMANEKKQADVEIVTCTKQIAALHKLCRTLQSERAELLTCLKISETPNKDKIGNRTTKTIQKPETPHLQNEHLSNKKKNKRSKSNSNSELLSNDEKTDTLETAIKKEMPEKCCEFQSVNDKKKKSKKTKTEPNVCEKSPKIMNSVTEELQINTDKITTSNADVILPMNHIKQLTNETIESSVIEQSPTIQKETVISMKSGNLKQSTNEAVESSAIEQLPTQKEPVLSIKSDNLKQSTNETIESKAIEQPPIIQNETICKDHEPVSNLGQNVDEEKIEIAPNNTENIYETRTANDNSSKNLELEFNEIPSLNSDPLENNVQQSECSLEQNRTGQISTKKRNKDKKKK